MTWEPHGPALLFCPADRPERFEKASAAADMVILDLEDGVGANDKEEARRALLDTPLDPRRTIVRVSPVGTDDFERDLLALDQTAYAVVMLAKTESADDVRAVGKYQVIALCETAKGVVAAPSIAAASPTVAIMWGAEDLIASLGGSSSRDDDGHYRDVARYARAQVLVAARAQGLVAIDAIHLEVADLEGLGREARDAVASGFGATACIHPSQVETVRTAYRPSESDVAWAESVLRASTSEHGVFVFNGRMVDAPLLRHAQEIVRRAGR
ncbi:MAG TPA: CoA ester lyase [Acidimicrobiales bacterium]